MKTFIEESVGAFLRNKRTGKFLLLRRTNDPFWEFPKGHINKGESHEGALKREINEETGISKISIVKKIGEIEFTLNKPDVVKKRRVYYYLVETPEEKINLSEEHSESKWEDSTNVKQMLKFDDIKKLFHKAIERSV